MKLTENKRFAECVKNFGISDFMIDYLATNLEDSMAYYNDELAEICGEDKEECETIQYATIYNISDSAIREISDRIKDYKKACKELGIKWDRINGGDLYLEHAYYAGLPDMDRETEKKYDKALESLGFIYDQFFTIGEDGLLYLE